MIHTARLKRGYLKAQASMELKRCLGVAKGEFLRS